MAIGRFHTATSPFERCDRAPWSPPFSKVNLTIPVASHRTSGQNKHVRVLV